METQTHKQLAIVVPCYNEAERLDRERFLAFARNHPQLHIYFVNDGSRDGTGAVLAQLAGALPGRITAIQLERNTGKGEATRTGLIAALAGNPAFVGYWDADLATPLETIFDFVEILHARPGVDLVMGARIKLLGRNVQRRLCRHYPGRIFATAASVMLNLGVYDSQCGAKLFRVRPFVTELFDTPFCSRWIFDVEILMRLMVVRKARGLTSLEEAVFEFPLMQWHDVGQSTVKPLDFFRSLLDLVAIRWRSAGYAAMMADKVSR